MLEIGGNRNGFKKINKESVAINLVYLNNNLE